MTQKNFIRFAWLSIYIMITKLGKSLPANLYITSTLLYVYPIL